MTIVQAAPPASLLGPPPEPPPYGLLSYLERTNGIVENYERLAGAGVWMYPCVQAFPHDPCAEGTDETKEDGEGAGDSLTFTGFSAYAPVICSSISVGADGQPYAEFRDRIERSFEAVESAAVEAELAMGGAITSGDANPHFGDAGVTTPGGVGALTPAIGIRWLEYAIGLTGRRGVIHAPPEVTAAWRWDELDEENGQIYTLGNKTPVIAGPGYQGAFPDAVGAPASGNSWAFATGGVRVYRNSTITFPYRENLDRSDNTVVLRPERDYLAVFDDCVQAAVLIDWTP